MSNDELPRQVGENSRDIADLKRIVDSLITEVIRPMSETTVAAQQRSLENATLFQNLLDEARSDRMENRRRFDEFSREMQAQRTEMQAQRAAMQALQEEMRAQQQAIQAMLVQMGLMNAKIDDFEAGD
jgi:hypothetical protein